MYASFGKRIFDIMMAATGTILLFPLFVIVALSIKINDGGPILFRQERVGRNGKVFKLYKFRSMPVDTESIPSDQIGGARVTSVGKIIRRTNIDELPQLLNVLIGDMSIVGPRPSLQSQIDLIELRRNNEALDCRPGLTGLAQIRAYDGMSVEEKAIHDGIYREKCSFLYDFLIILKTFGYLTKKPPVY